MLTAFGNFLNQLGLKFCALSSKAELKEYIRILILHDTS